MLEIWILWASVVTWSDYFTLFIGFVHSFLDSVTPQRHAATAALLSVHEKSEKAMIMGFRDLGYKKSICLALLIPKMVVLLQLADIEIYLPSKARKK